MKRLFSRFIRGDNFHLCDKPHRARRWWWTKVYTNTGTTENKHERGPLCVTTVRAFRSTLLRKHSPVSLPFLTNIPLTVSQKSPQNMLHEQHPPDTNVAGQMDRLEKEEEAARLAREKQLRSSQRLQVTADRRSRFRCIWLFVGAAVEALSPAECLLPNRVGASCWGLC